MSTRDRSETFNQLLSYGKTLDVHTFDILLGHENYAFKYDYYYSMKTAEIVENVYDYPNFINISSLSSYTDNYKKEGYFTRLNYNYNNLYYLTLSYRKDGSSRFAKDKRWGNFYSVGASWRISEEVFMQDFDWINNLRLRASYGETGNDDVLDSDGYTSYYPYQTLYDLGINNALEAGAIFQFWQIKIYYGNLRHHLISLLNFQFLISYQECWNISEKTPETCYSMSQFRHQ